ncbi:MAG: hypothetical protein RLZZ387_1645, partial [Chloroflexota bacterium]
MQSSLTRAPIYGAAERTAGATLRLLARAWGHPTWAALAALVCYGTIALAAGRLFRPTAYNYYPYLADAFLHGQLHLRLTP